MRAKKNILRGRRQFINQTLQSVAGLALALGIDPDQARAAVAGEDGGIGQPSGTRRHLINILNYGGMDSMWFHNAVPHAEMRGIAGINGATNRPGSVLDDSGSFRAAVGTESIFKPVTAASYDPQQNNLNNKVIWDYRYPNAYITQHPNNPNAWLGPGMNIFNASDLNDMLIWRGITASGGHFDGNRFMQAGQSSTTTSSFSAIIAHRLAQSLGSPRPLHYVQLAESSASLYNQPGPLYGPAQPIMIPDYGAWRAVTAASAQDLPAARRDWLNNAVHELGGVLTSARLQRAKSKDLISGFISSFDGAVSVLSQGYADSAEFKNLVKSYRTALYDTLNAHVFKTWFKSFSNINSLSYSAANDGSLDNPNSPGSYVYGGGYWQFQALTFRFALAEFLIQKNLSTVVDLPTLGLDHHVYLDDHTMFGLAIMTCYKKLINNLKATPNPEGGNLLDITTIAMHTEFDRSPLISQEGGGEKSGSSHHEGQTSLILAGYGVNTGKVIGDFKRGGSYTEYGQSRTDNLSSSPFSGFTNVAPYRPLPIDPNSGLPSMGGSNSLSHTERLFPTLLSIFDATALGQEQIAGLKSSLPFLKKS